MKKILILVLAIMPTMIFAAGLNNVIDKLLEIANSLYGLIITLIIVAFAWGVLKFVFQSGDDQEKGKNMMIWSIVAITVLMSIWGIVKIFQSTFGATDQNINAPKPPRITINE